MLSAQDIHFSQPQFSPLNISPGFAGLYAGDIRFAGSYRSQWKTVPVSYLTFSGSADMKLPNLLRKKDKLSLAGGILFNYDQAGDSKLTLSSFGINGTIHYQIDDQNVITLGVQSMATQRSFSMGGLQFNNQYNGDIFDPGRDSREIFNSENKTFIDISAGASWMLRMEDYRSQAIFGFGLYHLNGPNQSFKDEPDAQLPMRISLYSGGVVEFHPKWDFVIHAMGQIQAPYEELLLSLGGRYHLSHTKGKELAIQLGGNFRVGDAVIPTFELHYAAWRIGVSYDVNISDFETATNGNGGLEIGVIYTVTNVKPVDVFESCPVF